MTSDAAPPELNLTWDEVGLVCESLSFAPRTIKSAIDGINEEYSLGPRGAWIIMLVGAGPQYPLDITNVFRVGRSLITAELGRLTEAGLLTSRQNAADRRRMELALTAEGEAVCQRIRANLADIVHTCFAGYTREQVMLVARMLQEAREASDDSELPYRSRGNRAS